MKLKSPQELNKLLKQPLQKYLIDILLTDPSHQDDPDWRGRDEAGVVRDTMRDKEVEQLIHRFAASLLPDSPAYQRIDKRINWQGLEEKAVYLEECKYWLMGEEILPLPRDSSLPLPERLRVGRLLQVFKKLYGESQPWINEEDWDTLLSHVDPLGIESAREGSTIRRRRVEQRSRMSKDWRRPDTLPRAFFDRRLFVLAWLSSETTIPFIQCLLTPSRITSKNQYRFMGTEVDQTIGEYIIKLLGNLDSNPLWVLKFHFWREDFADLTQKRQRYIAYLRTYFAKLAKEEFRRQQRRHDTRQITMSALTTGEEDKAATPIPDKNVLHDFNKERADQKLNDLHNDRLSAYFKQRISYYDTYCNRQVSPAFQAGTYDLLVFVDRIKYVNHYLKSTVFSEELFDELAENLERFLPWRHPELIFDKPGLLAKMKVTRIELWKVCFEWMKTYEGRWSLQAWAAPMQTLNSKIKEGSWDRLRSRYLNEKFWVWCMSTYDLTTIHQSFTDFTNEDEELSLPESEEGER